MSETKNNLFRKESLDAIGDRSDVVEYARIARPSTVVLLVALLACCAVALGWLAFGRVNLKTEAMGLAFPHGGLQTQRLPVDGRVTEVVAGHGVHVEQGAPLMTVAVGDAETTVRAEHGGTVLSTKAVGERFEANEPVAYLLPESGARQGREIVALATFSDLRWLRPGMVVQATPADLSREDYGYATGRVESVDPYPISLTEAKERWRLAQFPETIFPSGAAYEVKILLDADAEGNLHWSRQKSSHLRFPVGQFCRVQILTRTLRVWQVLLLKLQGAEEEIKQNMKNPSSS